MSSSLYNIEKLNSENYPTWAVQVKCLLVTLDLWHVIVDNAPEEPVAKLASNTADQKALATLMLCIKPSELIHVKNCTNAKGAWVVLSRVYRGQSACRRVTLFKKLLQLKFKANEKYSVQLNEFTSLVEELKEVNVVLPEELVTVILLSSLPDELESFVVAMESRDSLPPFSSLTSKILEEEIRQGQKVQSSTETGFAANLRNRGKRNDNPKNKDSGSSRNSNYNNNNFAKNITCYRCGKKGHIRAQCKVNKETNDSANAFGAAETVQVTDKWILDSGASSHMCIRAEWFDSLKQQKQKIILASGNTKTVNEQTVSYVRERNVLNKKPLLATDENRSKEDDLTQLKITQLRVQLRAHGLSSVGRKDVLIQRLQSYLTLKAGKTITHIPYDVKDGHLATNKAEDVEAKHEKATDSELLDEKGEALEIQKSRLACVIENLRKQRSETPKLKLLPAQRVAENPALRAEDSPAQDCDSGTEEKADNLTQKKESIIPQFSQAEPHGKGTADSGETVFVDDEVNCSKNENIRDNSFVEPAVESVCEQPEGDVYVEYIQGLPHLTVPLPSRLEKCRFALRPVSHKVGDLIEMLKIEDHGIDRAVILNRCGVRIASTCAIDSLLDEPFWLQINDNKYEVIPPKRKKIDSEDLKRLSDVRTLVSQLYEALHVGEYHLYKEQELVTKIENLKFEISPLEMEKQELTKLAERKTVIATWVGLSLMAVQFGVLARLTWWEYSWDIMEPVTYFVTYGTTMAMYAYYCLTKSEYAFESIRDRLFLISIHKKAKRKNFDVDKYNQLKRQIAEAEYDLRRLRDPINLQLPPHIDRSQRVTPIEPPEGGSNTTGTNTQIISAVTSDKKPVSFRLPFLEPKN